MQIGKRITVASVLLALTAAIIIWVATGSTPQLSITVKFAGYTNDAAGTRLAMFRLINHSDVTIRRYGICHSESQQQPMLTLLNSGPSLLLAPGQPEIITVATPINQSPWRVRFSCAQYGWKMKIQDQMEPMGSGGLIEQFKLYRLWLTPSQEVRSEWIAD